MPDCSVVLRKLVVCIHSRPFAVERFLPGPPVFPIGLSVITWAVCYFGISPEAIEWYCYCCCCCCSTEPVSFNQHVILVDSKSIPAVVGYLQYLYTSH